MCKICVEWELGRLSSKEAMNAIGEILMISEDEKEIDHMTSIVDKILFKEMPVSEQNSELEEKWWKDTHGNE